HRRAPSASGNEISSPSPTAMAVSSTCWRAAASMSWPWRRTQSHLIQGSATATRRVTPRRLPVAFGWMLRLERVTKRFGDVVAVDELSLDVGEGEVCVLIGPSGCGKTTTLKMVNRLI